jgi:hypothetical protein
MSIQCREPRIVQKMTRFLLIYTFTTLSISNAFYSQILQKPFQKHVQKQIAATPNDWTLDEINARIKCEVCYETIENLSDEKLFDKYMQSKSLRTEILQFTQHLEKHIDNQTTIQDILRGYVHKLIPAGTKGYIRGNQFNAIVKEYIQNLDLEPRYEIYFEKHPQYPKQDSIQEHLQHKTAERKVAVSPDNRDEVGNLNMRKTAEIPDWYIHDTETQKLLIGMNQLDLWKGGQQTNRGFNYINHPINRQHVKSGKNTNNVENVNPVKLVCVVCNDVTITTCDTKVYEIFTQGFKHNTLCYLKNLGNIIREFFS